MSVAIVNADVRVGLRAVASDSVDCVVTSPPYYGLRSYLPDGSPDKALEIGLEASLDEYVSTLVSIFRDVRRVLKPTGTFWLNVGDSYAGGGRGGNPGDSEYVKQRRNVGSLSVRGVPRQPQGLKRKDLLFLPNRLALAMQRPWHEGSVASPTDRAWLAATIDVAARASMARSKGAYVPTLVVGGMPRATAERCASLTGSGDVVQGRRPERATWRLVGTDCVRVLSEVYEHLVARRAEARAILSLGAGTDARVVAAALDAMGRDGTVDVAFPEPVPPSSSGWIARSEVVWQKANPMPESVTDRPTCAHEKVFLFTKTDAYHFDADAVREPSTHVYPKGGGTGVGWGNLDKLHPMIGDRGRDRVRRRPAVDEATEEMRRQSRNVRNVWTMATEPYAGHHATFPTGLAELCVKAGCPVGGHVLDPFGGSGTTGMVAHRLRRDATLIELNPEYAANARSRIEADAGLFADEAYAAMVPFEEAYATMAPFDAGTDWEAGADAHPSFEFVTD